MKSVLICCGLLFLLVGCQSGSKVPGHVEMSAEEKEQWEIALVEMRIEKNEAFMDSSQTHLMPEDLPSFEGLNYYFPVDSLRFQVVLAVDSQADTVTLTKRRGEAIKFVRRGTVSFCVENQNHTLAVFGPADTSHGDYLWLPFFDATNGDATYGGGRYIDLELADDGTVDLDFNFAYNPLCDYNPDKYNCTLPPEENTLPFAVEAGEKLFRLEE
ncbi:MAG: DUF1684 domain-containing protein [bacterium]